MDIVHFFVMKKDPLGRRNHLFVVFGQIFSTGPFFSADGPDKVENMK